jgi:hypothetical protein
LAVLAQGNATAPAWSLARAIYGDPGLLPAGLDETRARILVGEAAGLEASRELHDLAETRAAIHGDDAPSRSLLETIAASLRVKAVVVVEQDPAGKPSARVFVPATGAFDTVLYQPDSSVSVTWGAGASITTWTSAANALHRSFADATTPAPAIVAVPASPVTPGSKDGPVETAVATEPSVVAAAGEKPKGGRPFYTSPWFWGAIGAAAFAGAAFFFASRDSSDPNIALQVQVPK